MADIESSTTDVVVRRFQKIPAKHLREMLALDPAAAYARVTRPLLAISGESDLQCNPEDAARIAKTVRSPVEHHLVPNVTHVLHLDEGAPSILGTAKLLEQPLAPRVLELVADWLTRQVGGRSM